MGPPGVRGRWIKPLDAATSFFFSFPLSQFSRDSNPAASQW